jgi:sulfate adenylyltransferase subunit 1
MSFPILMSQLMPKAAAPDLSRLAVQTLTGAAQALAAAPHHPVDILRLNTCGSVDDGKSTLIGRLLYDSKSLMEDQLEALERSADITGGGQINLANLTDGLRAEREQGITIDVAYRYFATPRRKFIIADTPGHIQYTRNMVTGASTADLAVVLVDARNGITEQTCRHSLIASLLRIPHLVLCVNKMDLVGWSEQRFAELTGEFSAFASRLDIPDLKFIPISALHGDNVVTPSTRMPWHEGGSLLYHLETVYLGGSYNHIDARFPVQTVIRPNNDRHHDFRGLAGRIASGVFKPGDPVIVLPSGRETRIKAIHGPDGEVAEAFAPMSVVITLVDAVDVSRGDMLAKTNNQPSSGQDIEAMVCWLGEKPLQAQGNYLLRHTTRETRCVVKTIRYKMDISSLHRKENDFHLGPNDIGRIQLRTGMPLLFDPYRSNRSTGSFVLVDEFTHATVGAGMIL